MICSVKFLQPTTMRGWREQAGRNKTDATRKTAVKVCHEERISSCLSVRFATRRLMNALGNECGAERAILPAAPVVRRREEKWFTVNLRQNNLRQNYDLS